MKETKIFSRQILNLIAKEIHASWLENEKKKAPPSQKATLKPWSELDEGTKNANRSQAMDILRKLSALGYTVAKTSDNSKSAYQFKKEEIEKMARMEHERWTEEKIVAGWIYGKMRNDALKIHNCLVPWEQLTDAIKKYDIEAVEAIPKILKSIDFVIVPLNQRNNV